MTEVVHDVESLVAGVGYNGGMRSAKGRIRVGTPLTDKQLLEILEDLAKAYPGLAMRPFAIVLSYQEPLATVTPQRMLFELIETLKLRAGGLPLHRFVWCYWLHARPDGCDGHLLAIPLDLVTGLVLPLYARDRNIIQLGESFRRLWDLECERASPLDPWRRDLRSTVPHTLRADAKGAAWFNQTDTLLADWIWAGVIRDRDELVAALEDSGAGIIDIYHTHIVITYEHKQHVLRGGKYSAKFPFDTVSGTAGKAAQLNPADRAREIAELTPSVSRLRSERAETLERFHRRAELSDLLGFSPRLAKYVRRDPYWLGGVAQSARERHLGGGRKCQPEVGTKPSHVAPKGSVDGVGRDIGGSLRWGDSPQLDSVNKRVSGGSEGTVDSAQAGTDEGGRSRKTSAGSGANDSAREADYFFRRLALGSRPEPHGSGDLLPTHHDAGRSASSLRADQDLDNCSPTLRATHFEQVQVQIEKERYEWYEHFRRLRAALAAMAEHARAIAEQLRGIFAAVGGPRKEGGRARTDSDIAESEVSEPSSEGGDRPPAPQGRFDGTGECRNRKRVADQLRELARTRSRIARQIEEIVVEPQQPATRTATPAQSGLEVAR